MDTLFGLYRLMQKEKIHLFRYASVNYKAATIQICGRYAIFADFNGIGTIAEETEVMAHELGHCMTGATHVLSSSFDLIERHEYKANKWAIENLIPFLALIEAYDKRIINRYELAEYFGVTEEFMQKAIDYYNRPSNI